MKREKKLLPWAIGLLVVVLVLLVVGKKAGWFGAEVSVRVLSGKVETLTITEQITANGKIQPRTEVKISPDVSGEIIELYVKEGDQVKAGDPLMVIKPEVYQSALSRAEAALNSSHARQAQAEAQLIERELAFKRAEQLFASLTIPQAEFETAQAAFRVAEAEVRAARFTVKSAEASVAEAREQLTKTRVFAPMPGTVSRLNVEKGERVVGTGMYAGTETMVIADLNQMEVRVDVNENDIIKVSLGDTALVEVDAYLNRKFRGVVTEIANSARTTGGSADQVTNFEVKIFLLRDSYADLVGDSPEPDFYSSGTAEHRVAAVPSSETGASPASGVGPSAGGNAPVAGSASSRPVNPSGVKYPFRPGMSATVDILTLTRFNVTTVPVQAVSTRLRNDTSLMVMKTGNKVTSTVKEEKDEVVFLIRETKGEKRAYKTVITTGIQDSQNIEVVEGVKQGDEIVTGPYNAVSKTLKDSMLVKIVTEDELYRAEKK